MSTFSKEIDELFKSVGHFFSYELTSGVKYEATETEAVIEIDTPGLCKEDLDIEINGEIIEITGKGKVREINKSFNIPKNVNAKQAKASMDKGVLTITLPFKKKDDGIKIDID